MKKITLLLLLICNFLSSQTIEETYHRVKIYYDSPEDLMQLENAGIALDHGTKRVNVFFESDFSTSEIEKINQLGFKNEVTIQDVRSFYVNQNDPTHKDYVSVAQTRNATCNETETTEYETPANFDVKPGNQFGGYYTYSEALQELDDMKALYPDLITSSANISNFLTEGEPNNGTNPSIGGNPIKWVKISDNPDSSSEGEPQLLYTAIHHAREPMSLQQLIFYMWYLLENYDSDPEVQSIVDNTELYFVPVVNPDGYLYNELTNPEGGGFWRKNRKNGHGVDNNRNYDYHIDGDPNNGIWGGPGSSPNINSEVHRGSGPFSEVENQAMKWFVEQHNFVIALNNHTFGQLIYYPFGYADIATPDDDVFQGITSLLTSQNGYTPLRDAPFSGDSDDFMYGTVGTHNQIFSMTPEVGTSFWPPASAIESTCKDMMFTNLTAAQLAGNFAEIEDNTANFLVSTSSNIEYSIKRLGLQDPANFTVSINPVSNNITGVGSPNTHNNMSYLQEIDDSISINLDPSISPGDEVTYEILINNGLFTKSIQKTTIFGVPEIALDDMGNDITTNWQATNWDVTTEDFISSSSSITDSPFSNYSNNENSSIILTNEVDLSSANFAVLSFYARWEIENNYDYVQLEVSTDNGNNWIPQCGAYTNTGVPDQNAASGQPLYDGTQNDWVNENIDLSDYLGESILIRFRLVSDNIIAGDGFYFDDLQIQIIDDTLSNQEFNTNVFNVFPNPVDNRLTIQSNTTTNYAISIVNLQGQLVFSSEKNTSNTILDYTNYADGMYLLNIVSTSGNKTFKIIKQ